MRVLLVQPPSPGIYDLIGLKLPPLGLAYLAASCRTHHEVAIVDLQVEDAKRFEEELRRCDLVGITATTSTFPEALRIARKAKDEGRLVVMGGYHVTFRDEEALRSGVVDYVVRGEGEEIFVELLEALERGISPENVPGISFLREGTILRTPTSLPPQDLDALPFPARDLLQLSKYWMTQLEGEPLVNVLTSRGCPFACKFCASSHFSGRKWRARSPENILRELETLYFDWGFRAVAFVDDNFTLQPERVERLCEEIERRRLKLRWWCFSRADTIVRHEFLVKKMAKAGLRMVYLGLESAERAILEDYGKQLTQEVARKALEILRKYGVKSWGSFILGSLRETKATIRKTIEFARKIRPDIVQFSLLTPFPGTALFEELQRENRILPLSWSLFDGAHPVVRLDTLKPGELRRLLISAYLEVYRGWHALPQAVQFLRKLCTVKIPFLARFKEQLYLKERMNRENPSLSAS
uniref:B12-binding domain-containing radical SAM protein n=1 Tax=Candidatus Caldatribacterium californiense TaxID=1454726 RepID=A0A7V3YLQ2_9BACT